MQYPDIFFTEAYQELFKDTAFGGEPCQYAGYLFYKRRIEGTPYFDIVSPYGYSGHTQESAKRLDSFHVWCLQENIITEFARLHPFIENHKYLESDFLKYEHEIFYIDLTQSEDEIWKGFDKGCKSAIKKEKMQAAFDFRYLYEKRMRELKADLSYLFTERFWYLLPKLGYELGMYGASCILLKYGDY